MSHLYPVAFRFDWSCGDEIVVGSHGNITGVAPYIGLLEFCPYQLTVVSEKQQQCCLT